MSSNTTVIDATVRTSFGKGASRRTRRDGGVPAVLYGHKTDPRHLALPALEFAAVLRAHGTNAVVELNIDGDKQLALTKSVVVHPIRNYIEHADLLVIRRGEKVVVEVTVTAVGEAGPATLVTQEVDTIEIEADALSIPESLEVSIEGATPGTQFTAGDITLPEGVTLQSDPELLVINVVDAPTEADLDDTAETPAEAPAAEAAE
ncbi:50S ribosomal protein L25/general stress protein Ctc [Millisia brevis]|uniref:50S ribosomal protein L25/general stress protein Ctc n=1 Tax=Millisia brevis TaxID=264148 RepID=UPI00082AD436|nr:50S ribosomal protein L25/general stress protein Ctc [Millisia brevis]